LPPRERLRVAVAETNALVLCAIVRLLETIDRIDVVSASANPVPIAAKIDSLKPDLVMMDMDVAGLAEPFPGVRMILLTIHDGAELLEAARRSSADAVLCKARLNEELPLTIRRLFYLGDG
jgi:DNA-binding NarL/FixJ family response regulator